MSDNFQYIGCFLNWSVTVPAHTSKSMFNTSYTSSYMYCWYCGAFHILTHTHFSKLIGPASLQKSFWLIDDLHIECELIFLIIFKLIDAENKSKKIKSPQPPLLGTSSAHQTLHNFAVMVLHSTLVLYLGTSVEGVHHVNDQNISDSLWEYTIIMTPPPPPRNLQLDFVLRTYNL